VYLTHPLEVKGFRYRRVKNVRDAADLADLLRMNRLPEAGIAPPATRESPELVRYRAKIVAVRSGLKAQVHAVLATAGVLTTVSDLFGVDGRQRLAKVPLGAAYVQRVTLLLELIDALDAHKTRFTVMMAEQIGGHAGYQAIQELPGVDPILGAVFVAEIGDVHRFADPTWWCSWAGLTPGYHESDTVVRRGHITEQGSTLVRCAAVEAIQRHPATSKIALDRTRIESRRGKNIAKIAVAANCSPWSTTGNGGSRQLDNSRGQTGAESVDGDDAGVETVVAGHHLQPACTHRCLQFG
jgi:transposase